MKNKTNLIVIIVFLILFFSEILAKYIQLFSYVDEILALVGIIRIIINRKKNRSNFLICFILIALVIGFVSNAFSGLNTNIKAALVDAFTMFKAFFIYVGFKNLYRNESSGKAIDYLRLFFKVFLIIAFVFMILNSLSLVNMTEAKRYGLKEYKFIFINAGSFGYYLMAILPLFEKNKKNNIYVFIILTLITLTLKGPQMIFVLMYVYYKFLANIKNAKKIRIILFPLVLIIILYLSKYQIENYLTNKSSARYILTEKAIVTANDYFPLGAGFATYGSEMSKRYYSPLYFKYNFNLIYGLGGDSLAYLNDNYWQMVLAQLGYFGIVINALIIITFCKNVLNNMKDSKYFIWIKSMLICVLIGSLGSAYITGCAFSTIVFMVCLIGEEKEDERKKY